MFNYKRKVAPKHYSKNFKSSLSGFEYSIVNNYLSIIYSISNEEFPIMINLSNCINKFTFDDDNLKIGFRYDGYLKNHFSKKMEKTNRNLFFTIGHNVEYFKLKKKIQKN